MLPAQTRHGSAGALLRALCALLVLAVVLAGMPYGLWRLGTLPTTWPTWSQATEVLLSPDDGTLLITVLTLIGWGCWLAITLALGLEATALLQHRTARKRRGLAGLQGAAAWLLGSLVLLSTPAVATAATTTPAAAAPATPSPTEASTEATDRPSGSERTGDEPTHRVSANNPTLWGIADERLGDGARWRDILALNPDLKTGGDLDPGTVLEMPSDTPPLPDPAQDAAREQSPATAGSSPAEPEANDRYVVEPGDSLWGIAESELSDGTRWPEIANANQEEIENPDLIRPGQKVELPAAPSATPPADDPAPPPRPGEQDRNKEAEEPERERQAPPAPSPTQQEKEAEREQSPAPESSPTPLESRGPTANERGREAPSPPAPSAPSTDVDREASSSGDRGTLVVGGLVTSVLAAGLLGLVWRRRVLQQRRRRAGRRIAMPAGRTADIEQALRTAQRPADTAFLDVALRTMAAQLAAAGRGLPALQLVQLGEDGIVLHLTATAEPVAPFTTAAADTSGTAVRWVCPIDVPEGDLLDAAAADGRDAPYPGLVGLGWDEAGRLLLADLEQIGVLHLTGPGRHGVLRTIAVELATSELADHLDVTLVGDSAPGLAALVRDRLSERDTLASALEPLEVHHQDQQRALAQLGLASLQDARLTEHALGGWTPKVVLASDAASQDELAALYELVGAQPRTSTVVVTTGEHIVSPALDGAWVLHADSTRTTVTLPGSGTQCVLQALDDEQYTDVLDLLATTEAVHDVPASDSSFTPSSEEPVSGNTLEPAEVEEAEVSSSAYERGQLSDSWESAATATSLLGSLADYGDEGEGPEGDGEQVGGAASPQPLGFAKWVRLDEPDQEPAAVPHGQASVSLPGQHSAHRGIPPADGQDGLLIRVLGPVEVIGADGELEASRLRTATELTVWLALHPHHDRHALREAMWPGQDVGHKTVNQLVSRTRRWLGNGPDGVPYLPVIPATADARYSLTDAAHCDWHLFRNWVDAGTKDSSGDGTDILRQALGLVRGQPFAGVAPYRYVWAEHLTQEMISTIVDASQLLAERYLIAGNTRGALWAATKGLEAAPEAEQLYRQLFQAHHATGDLDALRRAAQKLDALNEELGVDTEDATVALLKGLLTPT